MHIYLLQIDQGCTKERNLDLYPTVKLSWPTRASHHLYYSFNNKAGGLNVPHFSDTLFMLRFIFLITATLSCVPCHKTVLLLKPLHCYSNWLLWRFISKAMLQRHQLLLCLNKTARSLFKVLRCLCSCVSQENRNCCWWLIVTPLVNTVHHIKKQKWKLLVFPLPKMLKTFIRFCPICYNQ